MSAELTLGSVGRRIAARLFSPPDGERSGAAVLFVHGQGSSQRGYLERAAAVTERLGATCLTFDLSGHGESDGDRGMLTPRDHLEDVLGAFDALLEAPGVEPGRVGVCAASYGAYLAALLLGERDVRSALIRAPALYSDADLDRPDPNRLSTTETVETAAALRAVAAYGGPLLVVESEHDEAIPHAIVESYLRAGRDARHELIRGAAHRLSEERWKLRFVEIVVAWFAETLGA